MFEEASFQAQTMLIAGMILLGWFMIRQSIRRRRQAVEQWQHETNIKRDLHAIDHPKGMPLATAPADTQRWMVEMFDLQRELKAELDTKIVVVQALIRQLDQRLAQVQMSQRNAANAATPQSLGEEDR